MRDGSDTTVNKHARRLTSRMWNLNIGKALSEFGLHRLTTYVFVDVAFEGADRVLLGLFVDDMMMIGKLLARIGQVKKFLNNRFMK